MPKYNPALYQLKLIDHLLRNDRAAGFVGMGLGKTSSTLEALHRLFYDGATKGALVVAPLRVCNLTWPAEIAKWDNFRWMRVANYRTKEGKALFESGRAHVYLVNYDALPKLCEEFLKGRRTFPFDTIVFDELTKAKNPKSTRIAALKPYLGKFVRRWGLTGTPTPNHLLEIFAQIRLLDDGIRLGKSYTMFRETYFHPIDYNEYTWEPNPLAADKVYARIADLALVLRSSEYLDIPDTVVEDIDVGLPACARTAYNDMEKELIAILASGEAVTAINAGVLVNKLLQITGGAVYGEESPEGVRPVYELHTAKLEALASLGKKLGEPILVSCNYQHEQKRLKTFLPGAELFADATTDAQQQQLIARWNTGKIPYLIADPRSIGHGLNMQDGGRTIVWYSLPYSREAYDQMNARLARRGQKQETLVYRLVSPGTIDDAVAETLREKDLGQQALLRTLTNFQNMLL